jgi:hypothetical protein
LSDFVHPSYLRPTGSDRWRLGHEHEHDDENDGGGATPDLSLVSIVLVLVLDGERVPKESLVRLRSSSYLRPAGSDR